MRRRRRPIVSTPRSPAPPRFITAARPTRLWPKSPPSSPRIPIGPAPSAPAAKSFARPARCEAAFEALNQAIRLDPDNANGYENRGNAFNNAKKYDRAIEDYNEALRLKPDFAQAFSDRGAAWYFKGEYQKAIADYDEAIRLEPHQRAHLHQPWRGLPQARPHRPGVAGRHLGDPDRSDAAGIL